jgi:hypothetical protein
MIDWIREFLFWKVVPILLAISLFLVLLTLVSQIWCLWKYGRLLTW